MRLSPDSSPVVERIKCKIEKEVTDHAVWNLMISTRCDAPDHDHPRTIVHIRMCSRCVTWTEHVQIIGPEGGVFEMVLCESEVARYRANLPDTDLPL
jgi:hypothetical protein